MELVYSGVLFLFILQAKAALIVFPGQLDHGEGDSCRTRSGTKGTCVRECKRPSALGEPSRCGVADSGFLVCCELRNRLLNPRHLTDISAPMFNFECGINIQRVLVAGSNVTGSVLRPESTVDPALTRQARSTNTFPPFSPDIPTIPVSAMGVGGVNALKNAWPWMALIGEKDTQGIRWFCGGVLINDEWILSALHCFFHNSPDVVRLGEHDYNTDTDDALHQDFGVAEVVNYPNFTFGQAYHDLALLRLTPKPDIYDFPGVIRPVCLPWGKESAQDITNKRATLTGWGDTEFGGFPSSVLQEVKVTVFPSSTCDSSYSQLPHYPNTWPRGIGEETVCAGDLNGGRDACQGDSGGPLVTQDSSGTYVLAGIISQGYGCGHKDYPGLYVNTRHPPHLSWIKQVAFKPNKLEG